MEQQRYKKLQLIWLTSLLVLIYIMVFLGGATRLTKSGLSITEWKAITGILPPLNEQEWQQEFAKYQTIPEYQQINKHNGMDLSDFKTIFWWEYWHRIFARITGIIIILPLIFFALKRSLDRKILRTMSMGFLVLLLQGYLGWFMVKSGLKDNLDVSHLRLATHLTTAFIIFYIVDVCRITLQQGVLTPYHETGTMWKGKGLKTLAATLLILILLQIYQGGMVAGLDAGLLYNTFPKMGNNFIPNDAFFYDRLAKNIFYNPTMVQLNHRLTAYIIFILSCLISFILWKKNRTLSITILLVTLLQIILGIATLLTGVNIILALLHQLNALLLFQLAIKLPYLCKKS